VREGNQNAITDAAVWSPSWPVQQLLVPFTSEDKPPVIKEASFRDRVKHEAERIEHDGTGERKDILRLSFIRLSG
jgi:hypothetical protein